MDFFDVGAKWLKEPIYFGQKELAVSDKTSERYLIDKLIGFKCNDIRKRINEQNDVVIGIIEKMSKIRNLDETINEYELMKKDAQFRLEFFRKHNLEEKLQRRLGFDSDIRKSEKGIALLASFVEDNEELLSKHEDELRNFSGHKSIENTDYFKRYDSKFEKVIRTLDTIKSEIQKSKLTLSELREEHKVLISKKNSLLDEFATIERTLANELKTTAESSITTDEFLISKKKLDNAEAALVALKKSSKEKDLLDCELASELKVLKDLWHQEFAVIKHEFAKRRFFDN